MIDQRGLAFTPQQMSGYKGYSKGVLIGNWYEELNVLEEKMRLNQESRGRAATVPPVNARVIPSPVFADGYMHYGSRIQIVCSEDDWLLSIFPNKTRAMLPPNHTFVSAAQPEHGVGPIGRNVWTLRPASVEEKISGGSEQQKKSTDSPGRLHGSHSIGPKGSLRVNPAATSIVSSSLSKSTTAFTPAASQHAAAGSNVIRYGDKLLIVNEWGSADGHLCLVSDHRTVLSVAPSGTSSKKKNSEEVSACLGETSLGHWTVEPAGVGAGLDTKKFEGQPIPVDAKVVIRHTLSGSPLGVDTGNKIKGFVSSSTTNANEVNDCLVACFFDKEAGTRVKSITNEANFFYFAQSPKGTPDVLPTHLPTSEEVFHQLLERLKHRSEGTFHALRALSRTFRIADRNRSGHLCRVELKAALNKFMGVGTLNNREIDMVIMGMDRDRDGKISTTEYFRFLRGDMNLRRRQMVEQAFRMLAPTTNHVPFVTMKQRYSRGLSRHPEVLAGTKSEDDIVREFISDWDKNRDDVTSLEEFIEYYNDLSCSIDEDDYFELMIRNAWHISGGEGWCENTTCRRVLVIHTDGSEEIIEIKNDLGMDYDNTQKVLETLADQGVRDIVRVEYYGAV